MSHQCHLPCYYVCRMRRRAVISIAVYLVRALASVSSQRFLMYLIFHNPLVACMTKLGFPMILAHYKCIVLYCLSTFGIVCRLPQDDDRTDW